MGVFQNNLMGAAAAASAGGDFYTHQIANSVRFNASASAHMYHTQGTPTNVDKCTISLWVKRGKLTNANNMFTGSGKSGGGYSIMGFTATDEFQYWQDPSSPTIRLISSAFFRDSSAWYNVVIAQDSTQSTAADRNKIYINGVQYTDWGDYTSYSTLNSDFLMNTSGHKIFVGSGGASDGNVVYPFDGYIAEYVFIDGTQYASTDFGEMSNGVWIPKDPSGLTFGNNGCYLKFESSSDLGNDSSGNNNDFTLSNVSAHDQMIDTPTFNSDNGGNFATYDPLSNGSYSTLSEGNLKVAGNTSADACWTNGNFGMYSGKWYWEHKIGNQYAYGPTFGLALNGTRALSTTTGQNYAITWQSTSSRMYAPSDSTTDFGMGTVTLNNTGVTNTSTDDYTSFYLDCDNRKLWIAKNGTIPNSGDPANGTNPQVSWTETPLFPFMFGVQTLAPPAAIAHLNTGSNPSFNGEDGSPGTETDDNGYGLFKYAPPTGFLALCQANLVLADAINPAETDDDYPQKLFGAKTYTGTGSSNALTGLGFQPDWTWIKERGGINDHKLTDSTRGVTKSIESNTTALEATDTNGLTAFGTDGFTVGSDAVYNNSSDTYVSWNWRANGGTTSTNTQGSEDSTVQVDPSGSFSIVKWTGTSDSWGNAITLGHGLSAAPNVMLCKKYLGDADQWTVFFSDYGNYSIGGSNAACNSLVLNTNAALYTNQSYKGFGGVMPTSTVFTVDGAARNGSGDTILAYCFANCEGYIKSGTYVGNANANGTFVYTGFRPALIMTKSVASTSDWQMFDDKRVGYNVDNNELQANEADAEVTTDMIDILSNGFKMRIATDPNVAETYVYLALAKNPFKYATAR